MLLKSLQVITSACVIYLLWAASSIPPSQPPSLLLLFFLVFRIVFHRKRKKKPLNNKVQLAPTQCHQETVPELEQSALLTSVNAVKNRTNITVSDVSAGSHGSQATRS